MGPPFWFGISSNTLGLGVGIGPFHRDARFGLAFRIGADADADRTGNLPALAVKVDIRRFQTLGFKGQVAGARGDHPAGDGGRFADIGIERVVCDDAGGGVHPGRAVGALGPVDAGRGAEGGPGTVCPQPDANGNPGAVAAALVGAFGRVQPAFDGEVAADVEIGTVGFNPRS